MRLEENGVLDGSYNNTGVNNDPTLFSNNSGQKGLLLPNNDLVVAGSGLPTPWYSSSAILYKYRENGTKDESFGNSGVVIFTIDSLPLGCRDLIRYNDSSFLVLFGGAFFGTDTFIEKNIICKLNINGSIDSSFALNGILEIPASIFSTAEQIVLSEDGSIYIMGNYAFDNFYYSVVKLNSNLTLLSVRC